MDNIQTSSTIYNEPFREITDYEFDVSLMKFGSLINMLYDKKINQTNLLYLILEEDIIMDMFKEIMDIHDERILIYQFILRYPVLSRSKSTSNNVLEIYDRRKR